MRVELGKHIGRAVSLKGFHLFGIGAHPIGQLGVFVAQFNELHGDFIGKLLQFGRGLVVQHQPFTCGAVHPGERNGEFALPAGKLADDFLDFRQPFAVVFGEIQR